MTDPKDAASLFHQLHREGLLLLANAWDAGSARVVASCGARAIATTSAAVAWSHGYPDGDALPLPALAATVEEVVRLIDVPLSVDAEGGYSSDPAHVAEVITRIVAAGAVGFNLEDASSGPDLLAAKIERAKRAARSQGVDVFLNARTDVYLRGLAPSERRVEETLIRARRYRDAGADGIFVPGVVAAADIQAIAAGTPLPLNVLARPGLPSAAELERLGVRRLSAGSALAQAAYGRLASMVGAFLRGESTDAADAGALAYPDLNALMRS